MQKIYNSDDIEAAELMNLPVEIFLALKKAEIQLKAFSRNFARGNFVNPKRGRPRTRLRHARPILVCGNSQVEVDQLFAMLQDVLGPKTKGNKRHGYQRLYLDLLEVFLRLQRKGISLPRSGSLSAKAVREGVGEVLIKNSYTNHTTDELIHDLNERRRLGKVMKSVFGRLADSIKGNPHSKVCSCEIAPE